MININGIIGSENGQYSLVKLIRDVKSEPENQPVQITINSPGGDGDLAFKMYDFLRGLGRQIITESAGQCASAASILFLSGDKRIAGCPIMIHNPWLSNISGDAKELQEASLMIEQFEKRCEKFYSEKTGLDSDAISNLMDNETYLSPSEAVALSFATEAKQTALALIQLHNKKEEEMEEKKNGESKLQKILAVLFGEDDPSKKMMDLTTAAGETVSVDRDSGTPQVGDTASPDGTHVMPDGSTIVVLNGVITDITPASQDPANSELEQLKLEIAQLKKDLETAHANSKTPEEANQLLAIKMAGGTQWLAKQCSTYTPQARTATPGKPGAAEVEGRYQKKLELLKEKQKQAYTAFKN